MNRKLIRYLVPLVLLTATYLNTTRRRHDTYDSAPAASVARDEAVAAAFKERRSGVQVSGEGVVDRVLPDDNDGGRHQRFILRLASGQSVLVAHNIDIAPKIPSLRRGDTVSFDGVYEWNDRGGVLHWTHRDPSGRHAAGWLERRGEKYR